MTRGVNTPWRTAGCIRLQVAKSMKRPDELNAVSVEGLGRLLTLAERTGLYLDLTGICNRSTR